MDLFSKYGVVRPSAGLIPPPTSFSADRKPRQADQDPKRSQSSPAAQDFFPKHRTRPGVLEGLGQDLEEAGDLWASADEQELIPGMWSRLGSGLTLLDIPRRGLWRSAANNVIDPALSLLGVEKPERFETGFDVGNEFAEKLGELTGAFDVKPLGKDASILDWLGKEVEYRVKGLPVVAAQTAGTLFDIYTDPLTFLSARKTPGREAIEREISRPGADSLTSTAEVARGTRNPPLARRLGNVTSETVPEASRIYLHQKLNEAVRDLAKVRQEIPLKLIDTAEQKAAYAAVEDELSAILEASKYLTHPDYTPIFDDLLAQARQEGSVSPRILSSGESLLKSKSVINQGAQPRMDTRGNTFTHVTDEKGGAGKIGSLLPASYKRPTLGSLLEDHLLYEKVLRDPSQGPGLKLIVPDVRMRSVPGLTPLTGLKLPLPGPVPRYQEIPLVTPLTGKVVEAVAAGGGKIKDALNRLFLGVPLEQHVNLRNKLISELSDHPQLGPFVEKVRSALDNLQPETKGVPLQLQDVERIAASSIYRRNPNPNTPGVSLNADSLEGRIDPALYRRVYDEQVSPVLDFLESIAKLDEAQGVAGRGVVAITPSEIGSLRKEWDRLIQQRETDLVKEPFLRPIPRLIEEGVTFETLKEWNSHKIHSFLQRQLDEYGLDEDVLLQYGATPGQIQAAKDAVARAKERTLTPAQRLEQLRSPVVDQMATIKTIDDTLLGLSARMKADAEQLRSTGDPLEKAKLIAEARQHDPLIEATITAIKNLGQSLQYSPPSWFNIPDYHEQLRQMRLDLDETSLAAKQLTDEFNLFLEDKDGRSMFNLLASHSQKIREAFVGAQEMWLPSQAGAPGKGEWVLNPELFRTHVNERLGPDIAEEFVKEVDTFVNAFVAAGRQARDEFLSVLGQLETQLDGIKAMQGVLNESITPIRQLASAQEYLFRPVYDQFLATSLDYINQAKQLHMVPHDVSARGKVWLGFLNVYDNTMKAFLKGYGLDPGAVDLTEEAVRGNEYWKARAGEEATQRVRDGLYKRLFDEAGLDSNYQRIGWFDHGVSYVYGYRNNIERINQGWKYIIQAFDGNKAAAKQAFEKWRAWHENEMRIIRLRDNEFGINTRYLDNYLPHLIANGSYTQRRAAYEQLPAFLASRGEAPYEPISGAASRHYTHSDRRMLKSFDELEEFLAKVNKAFSSNPHNRIVAPDLIPETSYINLYAARLQNHYLAVNTINYLREMQRLYPHLIREVSGYHSGGMVLADPVDTLYRAAGEDLHTSLEPGRWSLRKDYADFLKSYIPLDMDNPVLPFFAWLSNLNYRIQSFNASYNGPGFIKSILANALVGNANVEKAVANINTYGFNPRNHPLFDEAARLGVVPWAGIDHNVPLRQVMNYRMGRPDTGPLDSPFKPFPFLPEMGATPKEFNLFGLKIPKEIKAGDTTILRFPEVGLERQLGFLWRLREPEYFRYFTWEVTDKQLRLAMYEQALEMGMKKIDAARFARNALVDYQMSWHNPRTKQWANMIIPFYPWFVGNLRLHIPSMVLEPRVYLIANHIANLANWYGSGHYREDNPERVGMSVHLPVDTGADIVYWYLNMPWDSIQNKVFSQLYKIWTAPADSAPALDWLTRVVQTGTALTDFVWSRARSIPMNLLRALFDIARSKVDPGNAPTWLESWEGVVGKMQEMVALGFWGLSPTIGPLVEGVTGQHPLWESAMQSGLGLFGPTTRLTPAGEYKEPFHP